MHYIRSAEQQALYEDAAEFARDRLNDNIEERDANGEFSRKLWKECCDYGITGLFIPEAYGGSGMDIPTTIHILEGFGYGCRDNGLALGLPAQMWSVQEPILSFGSEEQKAEYLPALCSGKLIAACGMTEPDSGSDAFSLKTSATKTTGGYLLNGHKSFIGLAATADIALIFASTAPDMKEWGISCFLVKRGTAGFSTTKPVGKMGLHTNPMGDILLDNCFVPEENRLGPEGIGVSLFNNSMDWERSFILAGHVGAMAYQLDQCIAFAREREQGGKPIGQFQAVSHRIAEMKVRLETSRLIMYQLAQMKEDGGPIGMEAAICNLHISEALTANAMDAVRIHGTRGYVAPGGIERDLRDFTASLLYSGTSDIQRNIIARYLGL